MAVMSNPITLVSVSQNQEAIHTDIPVLLNVCYRMLLVEASESRWKSAREAKGG